MPFITARYGGDRSAETEIPARSPKSDSGETPVKSPSDKGDPQANRRRLRLLPNWKRWHTVVALSFGGWVTLYAGRAVLSPVLATIGREWALDEAQLGLIGSIFFLSYAVMQVPTGPVR